MRKFLLVILSTLCFNIYAQPTWTSEIADIIYQNCSSCHHSPSPSPSPFDLMSYDHASLLGFAIQNSVADKRMPPWPADTSYRHFAFENILDTNEIQMITDWVNNGMPFGDSSMIPAAPVYNPFGSLLDSIDLTLQIDPYTVQLNVDDYRAFAIQTNHTDTIYINKVEVIPGLDLFVRDVDLAFDLSGQSYTRDTLDSRGGFTADSVFKDKTINTWQRGGDIVAYPDTWGIAVPPGADFVIVIHYAPGASGQTDDTRVNLSFTSKNVNGDDIREVSSRWLLRDTPDFLNNDTLFLAADQQESFQQQSVALAQDMSLIGFSPHMHQLGASYTIWALTPTNDTIPLIDIPKWSYRWQRNYTLPNIMKLPAGTVIYGDAVFDNSSANPLNPNVPPVDVIQGDSENEAAFQCSFVYAAYELGDENIVFDSTHAPSPPTAVDNVIDGYFIKAYPNPATDYIRIEGDVPNHKLEVRLFNSSGEEVRRWKARPRGGKLDTSIRVSDLPAGIYFIEWSDGEKRGVDSFLKAGL